MEEKTLVGQVIPDGIASLWREFQVKAGPDTRLYEFFAFGDSEGLAQELAELVLAGRKRATATLVWDYEAEQKLMPFAGCYSVVTDWNQNPLCVIQSTRIDIVAYDEVTAEFAAVEGEDDGSLESWRQGHRAYFSRRCKELGREFSEQAPVLCERFEVVYSR